MSMMFPHQGVHYGVPAQYGPQPFPHYGQPFTGAPNWQGGQPPWLAALLAAHQAAQPQAPQVGVIPNASALPPGLVGNTHVPFLQAGGSGYPGNYQGSYPGFTGGNGGNLGGGGNGQGYVNGGLPHPVPPTDGRVGV